MKDEILAKIKLHGINNPIFSSILEEEFKITGSELREIIHNLRLSGEPIASNSLGYYYAKDYTEIIGTINMLASREAKIREVRLALEKVFQNKEQLRLI